MKLKKSQSSPEKLQASDQQYGGDHYKTMGIQPWDVVDRNFSWECRLAVYQHGALKYLMRLGTKDDMRTELEKARHYIDKMLEMVQE